MRLAWYSAKVRKPASYKSAKSHKIEYEENYHRPIMFYLLYFVLALTKPVHLEFDQAEVKWIRLCLDQPLEIAMNK